MAPEKLFTSYTWCVCVCVFQTESERQCWKPVLVMLTEKDLLLFDSMPRMREHWLSPTHTYPLLATRYTLTHSVTALNLLVHTNTPLKNQSRYTHLHTFLFNTCLCTQTCKHTHAFCMPVGSADQLATKIHNFSQLERKSTKALWLLKAC